MPRLLPTSLNLYLFKKCIKHTSSFSIPNPTYIRTREDTEFWISTLNHDNPSFSLNEQKLNSWIFTSNQFDVSVELRQTEFYKYEVKPIIVSHCIVVQKCYYNYNKLRSWCRKTYRTKMSNVPLKIIHRRDYNWNSHGLQLIYFQSVFDALKIYSVANV